MKLADAIAKSFLGLALVAASSAAHALSIAGILHMHPHVITGQRATLKLQNVGQTFHDIRVGDKVYTLRTHESMTITAPVGTPVYAADGMYRNHVKGSVVAQVEAGERTVALD